MRATAAVLMVLAIAAPAAAQGPGGFTSDNVEFIGNHPQSTGVNEGGRLVGSTFYTTSNAQGLLIFDVAKPEQPTLAGQLFLPHLAENEDVATNGRILLLSQLGDVYHLGDERTGTTVSVIDVRDRAAPKVIATVDGGGDHTWDCLLDCTWAYSASGLILDLRDPSKPKLLDTTWKEGAQGGKDIEGGEEGIGFSHDVSELAPGIVMTASAPMFMLDARRDPVRPRVLAVSEVDRNSGHNVVWPNAATDRFLVTATESIIPGRCEASQNAALMTWDASRARTDRTFTPIDKFRPRNGTYTDGSPAASVVWYGCSAHWAEVHPTFRDGGLVAGAFYSQGVRLLNVDAAGKIQEVGYFLGHGAGASAVYWITDRIFYVVDLDRGIDVLRYTGPLPARRGPGDARAGGGSAGTSPGTPSAASTSPAASRRTRCVSRRSFRIRLRAPRGQRLRRATVYVNGRRVRVVRGKRLRAPVNLRGLPAGRIVVRISAVTTRGRRVTETRRYRTCAPRRGR